MKGGDNAIQLESHAQASPFNGSGPERQEQDLDTLPFQAGWGRRAEDELQGFAVYALFIFWITPYYKKQGRPLMNLDQ